MNLHFPLRFRLGCFVLACAVVALSSRAAEAQPKVPAKITAGIATVFDTSRLHQIEIEIPSAEVARLVEHLDDRLHCTFRFDGVLLQNVGVRQSGGDFHPYVPLAGKPSLSIKFDEFVKGQELHGLDKIVLKNGLQDLGWVNEHMVYEVFRRAGLPAPMTAHAHVVINGIDLGLYVIREPIDKEFLTRNFGTGNDGGNLYELGIGRGLYDFVNQPGALELKDEAKDGRKRDDLNRFAAIVGVVPPESFVQAVSQSLDLDRYLTYFAVEAVSSVMDGFSFHNNNTYLYVNPRDGRFVMLPYGADEAFWVTGSAMTKLTSPLQSPFGILPTRVQADPGLMERFKSEIARVSQPPIWDKQVLLDRVAQVGRILAAADKTPRLEEDIARFNAHRPEIESFINSSGTMGALEKKQ